MDIFAYNLNPKKKVISSHWQKEVKNNGWTLSNVSAKCSRRGAPAQHSAQI